MGKILLTDLSTVVTIWVEDWKEALSEELAQYKGEKIVAREKKCDINGDKVCNLVDFSILMAWVGKEAK